MYLVLCFFKSISDYISTLQSSTSLFQLIILNYEFLQIVPTVAVFVHVGSVVLAGPTQQT